MSENDSLKDPSFCLNLALRSHAIRMEDIKGAKVEEKGLLVVTWARTLNPATKDEIVCEPRDTNIYLGTRDRAQQAHRELAQRCNLSLN